MIRMAVAAVLLLGAGGDTIEERHTGEGFPAAMRVGETDVVATGAALRTYLFVRVFVAAHYIDPAAARDGWPDEPAARIERIRTWQGARAMTFRILYPVGADRVRRETIRMLDAQNWHCDSRQDFIDTVAIAWERGMEITYRLHADGTVEWVVDGEVGGTWQDPSLASMLYSAWFGEDPAVDHPPLLVSHAPAAP